MPVEITTEKVHPSISLASSSKTQADTHPLLALALGNVPSPFQEAMMHNLPTEYLTNWDVKNVANTTDSLMQAIITEGENWRTLMVTTDLQGTLPITHTLVEAKRRYP